MSATPLVALHGWGADARIWPAALKQSNAYQWLDIELPGYGCQPETAVADFSTALERIADAAPRRCHVLGWSLGAQFALAWAERHPAQVERLVLMAATPRFIAAPDWPQGMAAAAFAEFAAALAQAPVAAWRRFQLLQAHGDAQPGAVARTLRMAMGNQPPAAAAVLCDSLAWLRDNDLRALCSAISQHCLVIQGSADAITPPAAAAWLAARLPAAKLQTVEDAAHAPFLSNPAALREAIEVFLA